MDSTLASVLFWVAALVIALGAVGLMTPRQLLIRRIREMPNPFGSDSCAAQIIRELETPCHRRMEGQPVYDDAIFHRYSALLWKDMKRMLRCDIGPRCIGSCLVFSILYLVLTTRTGFRMFGQKSRGLYLLLGALSPAARDNQRR